MIRILLLGASGQLGKQLQLSLNPKFHLTAIPRELCDITDDNTVRNCFDTIKPEIVINAAAFTAVDKAEGACDEAYAVNATATKIISQNAHRHGSAFIHFSTDYVFDGAKGSPYNECDTPSPLNVYGKSKLYGEMLATKNNEKSLIIRTSWVYSEFGRNFVKSILENAKIKPKLKVVADQIGCPTSTLSIAKLLNHIIPILHEPGHSFSNQNIYHYSEGHEQSWKEFATRILSIAVENKTSLMCNPKCVEPISTSSLNQAATRPAYSALDSSEISNAFEYSMPDHITMLSDTIKNISN